jgi:cytochrome c oxidase subunit 2
MKIWFKIAAVAAAFGLGPAALAQPSEGTAQQAATAPTNEVRAAPAASQTAQPTPAITGAPSEAATESTANAPSAETKDVPAYATPLSARENVGAPDGRIGIQDQVTPIGREAEGFHNYILMPAITLISLIVLGLMLYVILRYRRAAHPVPSRTTHNTMVEVLWTLIPVLILVVIAVPSIRLLAHQYSPPNADLTVKVIGNQWYWNYEYPDHNIQLTSTLLPDEVAAQKGEPRLLGVDERMVVPVGATVKLLVTSNDVIHSFGVPAFWVKMDAVPGRINETWFKAEQPGIYYGQCYELCGARHAYMPIAVEVVSQEDFARWVASKGGAMPGAGSPSANATANVIANQQAQEGRDTDSVLAPTNEVEANVQAQPMLERTDEPQ